MFQCPMQVFDCSFCPQVLREKRENPAPKKRDQPSFEIAHPENADSLALAAILELLYVCSGLSYILSNIVPIWLLNSISVAASFL